MLIIICILLLLFIIIFIISSEFIIIDIVIFLVILRRKISRKGHVIKKYAVEGEHGALNRTIPRESVLVKKKRGEISAR